MWRKMTVEHALRCKVGGLVHCRHNDVAREFDFLCSQAFFNGAVNYKPHIYYSDQCPIEDDAATQPLNPSCNNTKQLMGRTQPQ